MARHIAIMVAVLLSGFIMDDLFADSALLSSEQLKVLASEYEMPGVGVCIVRGGNIELHVAGVRRMGASSPIEAGDLFHICSCTKFMTACLVQMAVSEHKVSREAPLRELFAGKKGIRVNNDLGDASIAELIACRSGLPEDRDPSAWPSGMIDRLYQYNASPREGRAVVTRFFLGRSQDVPRDGKYRYSNIGFIIAGHVLEEVYGSSFEKLITEKLFRPLGMKSAGFGAPVWVDQERQPFGHCAGKPTGTGKDADNPLAIGPAGTVRMSLRDMGRYLQFVMQRKDLFSRDAFAKLLEPAKDGDYINGWVTKHADWAKGRIWLATGSNTQFFTLFLVAPSIDLALAVSVNCGDDKAGQLAGAVASKIVSALAEHK